MQLNLQFGNIPLGFLVHSPSLAQAGQLGLESLILELQLFLQLTKIQSGFLSHWPVCPLMSGVSTTISIHLTKDCRFPYHWRPWGCLAVVVPMRNNVFSTFLFSIKSRTRVPFRVLQSRHSDANFSFNPVIPMQGFCYLSAASLTHKNPQGSKIIHMLPRRTQRSIDRPQDAVSSCRIYCSCDFCGCSRGFCLTTHIL